MSIRSLARQLDLSIGTVSRALNDRPDVNEDTRARVKAAAAAAGYEPNQSGRSLRKGCTGMVAAVIPTAALSSANDCVVARVFEGVRRLLHHEGVDLVVLFRGPDEDPLSSLQRIVSRRIADAIILTQTRRHDPRIDYLNAAGMRFVAFGRSADCAGHAWVDFDYESAAATTVRHFAEAGHRRLALATDGLDVNSNDVLRDAFLAEAGRRGLSASLFEMQEDQCEEATLAALAACGQAPTAFLAGNEVIAARLYRALASIGRPVGVASAVASALPSLAPGGFSPALASFEADLDAVGCALARRLLAILPGVDDRAEPCAALTPGRFVPRDSGAVRPCVMA